MVAKDIIKLFQAQVTAFKVSLNLCQRKKFGKKLFINCKAHLSKVVLKPFHFYPSQEANCLNRVLVSPA